MKPIQVDIATLIINHNLFTVYLILFLIMCIEGPTITTIAAFAAYLGYLNIWIVLALAIFGSIIPDCAWYFIGRSLRNKSVERVTSNFGLSKERVLWLEKNIKNHSIKSVIIVKLVPPLPIPGLILTGFMRMHFKKFFLTQAAINIIGGTLFTLLGFYSGLLTDSALKYLRFGELMLPAFILIIIGLYFLSKLAFGHLSRILKTL